MMTRSLAVLASGRTRRVSALALTAVTAGSLYVTPGHSSEAVASVSAETQTGIGISDTASSWKPSSNARVKTILAGSPSEALQVKPARSAGTKSIEMRSALSPDVIDTDGTAVTVTARLRTSQPGRVLTLRAYEVSGGKTVDSKAVTVKPSSTSWRDVRMTFTTHRDDTRIQLKAHARSVRGSNYLRLTDVRVVAAATAPPKGDQPAATACEKIDYSDPAQGVRTFSEDFNGTSIDRSTWRVRDDTFLNQDQAWITKDAVSVHDGYLDIAGKRLPASQHRKNTKALYDENVTRDYSTGYIDTIDSAGYGNASGNRFGQKYGHFEMRAKVPSESTMSRGIWPAFWLRGDHESGEIDPMESYGGPTIRSYDPSSSYEWNSWADTAEGSMTGIVKRQTHGRADVGNDKIWQDWHTYGVNWSPNCLRYLYDGRTVGLVEFDDPATASYFREKTFDDTFHIRLNMQIGSKYWGWADPQHTRDNFGYKVDWVRVHQGKGLTPGR